MKLIFTGKWLGVKSVRPEISRAVNATGVDADQPLSIASCITLKVGTQTVLQKHSIHYVPM